MVWEQGKKDQCPSKFNSLNETTMSSSQLLIVTLTLMNELI